MILERMNSRNNWSYCALNWLSHLLYIFLLAVFIFFLAGCDECESGEVNSSNTNTSDKCKTANSGTGPPGEISLFDGKKLGKWKVTDFGGQGKVYVKDGAIYMEFGYDMTGITWTGPVIRMNYEISLEAMRVDGSDFFCGLTFPVRTNSCSLILGGWGGSICGLSSLDYLDASENETTAVVSFENGQWYKVRVRVTPDKIEAWLDDELLVDVETTDQHIDVRMEMEDSVPLGIATWQTAGAVRNIRVKKLKN